MVKRSEEQVTSEGEPTVIRGRKLRHLLDVVRRQEVNNLMGLEYDQSADLLKFLAKSKEAHDKAVKLTEPEKFVAADSNQQPQVDNLNRRLLEYVEAAAGLGITMFQNFYLRLQFLDKVQAYADTIITRGNKLASLTPAMLEQEVKAMLDELIFHSNVVHNLLFVEDILRTPDGVKLNGKTLEDVVKSYYSKLIAEGRFPAGQAFELLEDQQKAQVYLEIVLTWKKQIWPDLTKIKNAAAAAMVLYIIGMMAFDILTAEHKIKKVYTEFSELAGGYFGSEFVSQVLGFVAKAATMMIGVEFTGPVVAIFMFAASCAGGFYIAQKTGEIAGEIIWNIPGWVFDQIIGSGGKHTGGLISVPSANDKPSRPVRDIPTNYKIYKVPMPDGRGLARQIASYNDGESS